MTAVGLIVIYERASAIIKPHSGVGGLAPSPKNESELNARMIQVNCIAISVNTTLHTLGSTSPSKILTPRPPCSLATRTKSRASNTCVLARATRAIGAAYMKPRVTIKMNGSCPKKLAISSSNINVGNASKKSINLDNASSTQPPANAASEPSAMPMTAESAVAKIAITRDGLPPWSARLKTSRPNASVPSQ